MRLRSQKYQASYLQNLFCLLLYFSGVHSGKQTSKLRIVVLRRDFKYFKQGLPIHELSAIELPTAK